MKNFEEMISGEIKRREKAINWLHEVTEALKDVACEVYGDQERFTDFTNFAMSVWYEKPNKNGKIERWYNDVYFRYDTHQGTHDSEAPGFYLKESGMSNRELYWGTPVEDLKGSNFWRSIHQIKEWLPLLEKDINRKANSRQEFVKTLIVK